MLYYVHMTQLIVVTRTELHFANKCYKVAIGRSGLLRGKNEGDGTTPVGVFPVRRVFYRPDRLPRPETLLPLHEITDDDFWCDDVSHEHYNTLVHAPHDGSAEKLFREDGLYDLFVELGYNDSPAISGKGSAIFMHIARDEYTPTEGCIALTRPDLTELVSLVTPETQVEVTEFDFSKTYLSAILGSVGAELFRHSYASRSDGKSDDMLLDGELSCAFFVTSVLKMFDLIAYQHATVSGTTRDLHSSGWYSINVPLPGAVIVWGPSDAPESGGHPHVGFYVGEEMAISNSKKNRSPVKHHYKDGMALLGPIIEILWHPRLGKIL